MHPPQTEADTDRVAVAWKSKVETALLSYENQQRILNRQPHLPHGITAIVATRPKDQFQLLNWRVWCLRYNITPRLIIETLLEHHSKHRHANANPKIVSLGVAIPTLTGVAARKRVEEEVLKRYPNSENVKIARQQPQIIPLQALNYNDTNMVTVYRRAITERREAQKQQQRQIRRPYRGR